MEPKKWPENISDPNSQALLQLLSERETQTMNNLMSNPHIARKMRVPSARKPAETLPSTTPTLAPSFSGGNLAKSHIRSSLMEIASLDKAKIPKQNNEKKNTTERREEKQRELRELKNVQRPDSGRVSKIATLFTNEEKAKELESIIALKSRQIWRLQKEVKNLLQIQTQQAQTLEGCYEDAKEFEEKVHTYEQKQKVDERAIRSLQDKLAEALSQYQRLLNSHVNLSEEDLKVSSSGTLLMIS
jgi:hypothetical protein